jgi:hypothetical protein
MTNRQKIIKACKDAGVEIKQIKFQRCTEYIYGDSVDASFWDIDTNIGAYCSGGGDSVDEGVDIMIEDIKLDALDE